MNQDNHVLIYYTWIVSPLTSLVSENNLTYYFDIHIGAVFE